MRFCQRFVVKDSEIDGAEGGRRGAWLGYRGRVTTKKKGTVLLVRIPSGKTKR